MMITGHRRCGSHDQLILLLISSTIFGKVRNQWIPVEQPWMYFEVVFNKTSASKPLLNLCVYEQTARNQWNSSGAAMGEFSGVVVEEDQERIGVYMLFRGCLFLKKYLLKPLKSEN